MSTWGYSSAEDMAEQTLTSFLIQRQFGLTQENFVSKVFPYPCLG